MLQLFLIALFSQPLPPTPIAGPCLDDAAVCVAPGWQFRVLNSSVSAGPYLTIAVLRAPCDNITVTGEMCGEEIVDEHDVEDAMFAIGFDWRCVLRTFRLTFCCQPGGAPCATVTGIITP
ncbi:MAG: hypothetical protein EPN91_04045 [Salinibacterium sp.]|nr:MAG: hypothetical protein EPN91_04045 [Salinibacterium sp.]